MPQSHFAGAKTLQPNFRTEASSWKISIFALPAPFKAFKKPQNEHREL